MYQPSPFPTPHLSALDVVHCDCGFTGPSDPPALRWLMASHLGSHEPEDLVLIPVKQAFALEVVFASARGIAGVVAPALVRDLAMAGRIVRAADYEGWSDCVMPTRLLTEVAETARVAATALRGVSHQPGVVEELDEVGDALARRLANAAQPAGVPSSLGTRVPRVRSSAPTALEPCLRGALQTIGTPLLLELPPDAEGAERIEGRQVRDLVDELFGLGAELRSLEASVRGCLAYVERNLRPLPTLVDAALDDLAEAVLSLQLAKLKASLLGELLGSSADAPVARWATATSETLVTRLRTLTAGATTVLEVFDAPREATGWSADRSGCGERAQGW